MTPGLSNTRWIAQSDFYSDYAFDHLWNDYTPYRNHWVMEDAWHAEFVISGTMTYWEKLQCC